MQAHVSHIAGVSAEIPQHLRHHEAANEPIAAFA
jgi:hypothetical protein